MAPPSFRHLISWIGFGGLIAILAGFSSLAVARYQLENKADRSEVQQLRDQIEDTREILLRVDARVSAMYCGQVPPEIRGGCQ